MSTEAMQKVRHKPFVWALVALVSFALFYALGYAVGRNPDPAWLLTIEATWVNHSTLIAWWLTWFGFAYALVPICLLLIVMAVFRREWRARAAFAIVSLLLSWQGADAFQRFFMRPRRLDWVVKHETAFSYPSSHAAIVAGFYAVIAVFVWQSTIPYRRTVATLIGLLCLGILWSRLSLAAHYITDLAGGVLWGATVVGALASRWPRNVFEGPSASSLE
jgi:membrane-associated phospholipid phosphatase